MADPNIIQFLGTGAGDFFDNHARDCNEGYCIQARHAGGKSIRQASSLFVAPDVLIDFNTEKQIQTFGIDRDCIRHLLITHPHFDHFQPVEILDVINRQTDSFTVYGPSSVIDTLAFQNVYRRDTLTGRFTTIEPTQSLQTQVIGHSKSFNMGEIKVTAVWANHLMNLEDTNIMGQALNFILERGNKTLFYGLDSSCVLPGTMEILSAFRLDIVVFDATFGHLEIDPRTSGHLNFKMLDETVAQFRQAGILKENAVIVASHISLHNVEPHDQIVAELAAKGITLAYDGMRLEF
jgi:phosphoribosyl 1,2-cyclic phosphate phosphodiesterase